MKKIFIISLILMLFSLNLKSTTCEITKEHGQGYTTTIQSVIDNCDNFLITIRVEHNGCSGPSCQELSHYSIEAIQNTYSDISVDIISGNMTYGNIDYGPNLGQDPFQGFKIDDTNNIGGGNAGIFTITYNLDYLQNQQFLVKAGNNLLIVNFSIEEFTYVMNCYGTICQPIINYYPATGFGTLAFEDLWPSEGDYDFNDLVIDYRFKIVNDSIENCMVDYIESTFIIKAFGASFHNGFGFVLPYVTDEQIEIVTGYDISDNSIFNISNKGLELGQSKSTIIVFDDSYRLMQHYGGIGVNTNPNIQFSTPDTIKINIKFNNSTAYSLLDIGSFNPFIIVNKNRGKEVHLPNYKPTDLVDISLFGTYDDDSNPTINRYYKTKTNLPWAINIYESFDYTIEKAEIIDGYLKFKDWVESGGILYPDWYINNIGYRNDSLIYQY